MVRFSDMLGGSGEPDEVRAADSPYAELASDLPDDELDDDLDADDEDDLEAEAERPANEPEPHVPVSSEVESPEAVLERLERYASSARSAEPPPNTSTDTGMPAEAEAVEELEELEDVEDVESEQATGDDFLPRARGVMRRSWSRKRHP